MSASVCQEISISSEKYASDKEGIILSSRKFAFDKEEFAISFGKYAAYTEKPRDSSEERGLSCKKCTGFSFISSKKTFILLKIGQKCAAVAYGFYGFFRV
jgi:hypothetical protein